MADYRALYRKWRPDTFDEVCGQDGITDILKYEVANNKLSHAYLFCGSRGTGKTSCAKILAKAVNCENPQNGNPCNKCESCRSIDMGIATDVIEMDAASNNGIGDVRDLQDEIAFTPALLKFRVYIIDEVHMMSGAAFNALLKTLEEPPEYVIFILATTEYNKLPTTIVSRCQRFDFKRIATETIIDRLLHISENEGIEITRDAARIIARVSRGGMRDAISLLELCAGAHTKIDDELVFATVGSGNRESAYKIVESCGTGDFDTVYSIIDEVVMKSGDLSVFWQEIIDCYRDIMVVKNSSRAKTYLDLTDSEFSALAKLAESYSMPKLSYHTSLLEGAMSDMQRAYNSKRSIAEITLTRMCDTKYSSSNESLLVRIEELEKTIKMMRLGIPMQAPSQEEKAPAEKQITTVETVSSEKADTKDATKRAYSEWETVVEKVSELKKSLAAGINGAKVIYDGRSTFYITLSDFFATRISQSETDIAIIKGVIAEIENKNAAEIIINIENAGKQFAKSSNELDDIFK